MKKVIIFGAGGFGKEVFYEVKGKMNVIAFADNDSLRWGEELEGIPIIGNSEIVITLEHDEVILGTTAYSIVEQLINAGEPQQKINTKYMDVRINARINFIRDLADIHKNNYKKGCIAEGGVFQGEFSRELNKAFPESELYLFDTFEGFDDRDVETDLELKLSNISKGHFSYTSEEKVMSKMMYPERVHIIKGYFPESVSQVDENNRYLFVNLDFDLYNPTYEGLKYFYPRLLNNGVILIHDYYHLNYKAVPEAIKEYEKNSGVSLLKIPIGDHCSIAIIKR